MGAPPTLVFDSLNMKAMIQENIRNVTYRSNPSTDDGMDGSLCTQKVKLLRQQTRRKPKPLRKPRKVSMKRRRSIIRRQDENGIVKKVRTLQRLIPSRESGQGLEGLFSDTASYIISLQMRVRVMQIMVDVLENSPDHYD